MFVGCGQGQECGHQNLPVTLVSSSHILGTQKIWNMPESHAVSSSLTLHGLGQPVLTDTQLVPPLSRSSHKQLLSWSDGGQICSA